MYEKQKTNGKRVGKSKAAQEQKTTNEFLSE